ncbi:MAG: potassium/proton antiporter [Micropruina sp.]|nr:potassium/proton antiporter [Micropruina sp.]
MNLDTLLLITAAVLLVAIGAARLGTRLGLPSLLLFLGLGLGLGPFFPFNDAQLAHDLGFAALVLILGEGGFTTRWSERKRAIRPAGLLATLGVAVTIGAMTAFGYFVLQLDLATAVLLGAITAPTDSAAVFSVLRAVPLPARVRGVLEAESGLNDAPVVLLVSAATAWALGSAPAGGAWEVIGLVAVELVLGVALGLTLGFVGVMVMRHVALPASGLYPLTAMGWVLLSYGTGVWLHVSGFAAVYVCAIVLGNSNLPHRNATRSFAEGIGWIAQIGLFVMLGLLATPARLTTSTVLAGLAAGLFLTLVARPLSVWVCAVWFKIPWQEQAFISWAGLRGAVPIIMATVPLASTLPQAPALFDMVFVFVVVFTLAQAPSLAWCARVLGISSGDHAVDIEVEVAPLDRIQADFMQINVPEKSRLHGVSILELRLPRNTVVSLIIRDGEPFAPNSRDILKHGDELLVVVPATERDGVERRFRAIGRGGRLAKWNHEPDPD